TDERRSVEGPIYVIDVQDEDGVHRHPIGGGRFVVGTSAGAALRVRDELVSRSHCELRAEDGRLDLVDLASKNGSYLGGARVQSARLGVGSVIVIGDTTLSVGLLDADDDDDDEVRPLPGIAGGSVGMRRVARQVRQLAKLRAAVLVRGETGTGKELVAHALHDLGPRADHPFVPLNVANLPRDLVESELFGHERGAFTGAVQRRAGAFAEADQGTLFLDEIGELPADAQPKLLRALDGYEVRRVGSQSGGMKYGARVVAATHVPLEDRVEAGHFRRDLFHRLEVCVIALPALRDRTEDIPALAKTMLHRMRAELGERKLTSAALARLLNYPWPG
ncbi:MAG: FHA domain-containing protein, partial [Proteobacteria bacterium]